MMPPRVPLALLFVIGAPSVASAQAWTRDAGSGYVNLSVSVLSGDELFGADGESREIASTYRQTTVGLYAELGVIDRWLTATVNAELFRDNRLDDQGATRGVGDLRLGLWTGLVTTPFRLTAGLQVGLPTGDDVPGGTDGVDPNADLIANSLPTGDGEVDFEPQVILGHSFGGGDSGWPLQHFATARVGYWLRTKGFNDAFTYQAELGTKVPAAFLDRFWLTVRLRGVESLASAEEVSSGFGGLGDGVTYTSLSGELYGHIWGGLGASVSYDTAFRARGIIAAAPIKFAISWQN